MAKSTSSIGRGKSTLPKGFPLTLRADGRLCKKVRGSVVYFGRIDDPQAALERWLEQKDDLLAGRKPRPLPTRGSGPSVADVCNAYLDAKRQLLDNREIVARTFADCFKAAKRLAAAVGRDRPVSDLKPDDFAGLRESLARTLGPVALGIEIQRIRAVLKFAADNGIIDRPVVFGTAFKKPSRKVLRLAKAKAEPQEMAPADLRRLIDAAGPQLKAMILLGLNGGFGNRDLAMLPLSAVDLPGGWIRFAREKTGVPRKVPLWNESRAALEAAIAARPQPRTDEAQDLVFVTAKGAAWVKHSQGEKGAWTDAVGLEFGKLLRKLGLKRKGIGFYTLRRLFRTAADESRDQPAVMHLMGHAPDAGDMGAVYRLGISDDRLRAVVQVVRTWLYATPAESGAT